MAATLIGVNVAEGRCPTHNGLDILQTVADRVTAADQGAGDFLFALYLQELEKYQDAAGAIQQLHPDCPDCAFEVGATGPLFAEEVEG
jgi:hypothetical protein